MLFFTSFTHLLPHPVYAFSYISLVWLTIGYVYPYPPPFPLLCGSRPRNQPALRLPCHRRAATGRGSVSMVRWRVVTLTPAPNHRQTIALTVSGNMIVPLVTVNGACFLQEHFINFFFLSLHRPPLYTVPTHTHHTEYTFTRFSQENNGRIRGRSPYRLATERSTRSRFGGTHRVVYVYGTVSTCYRTFNQK